MHRTRTETRAGSLQTLAVEQADCGISGGAAYSAAFAQLRHGALPRIHRDSRVDQFHSLPRLKAVRMRSNGAKSILPMPAAK
jgi:hypothetical protein